MISLPAERHGSEYGGWVVYTGHLAAGSTIYSFGIGEDVSFDLSMISRVGVTVHGFDPTPTSVAWVERQSLPDSFIFHRVGVADFDGEATFRAPLHRGHASYRMIEPGVVTENLVTADVRRLSTIMDHLGHDHIDLLKLDIEGAEYGVISDALAGGIDIRQLLVEFHHGFETIGVERTNQSVTLLRASGFETFYVSPKGEEYSFIRKDAI